MGNFLRIFKLSTRKTLKAPKSQSDHRELHTLWSSGIFETSKVLMGNVLNLKNPWVPKFSQCVVTSVFIPSQAMEKFYKCTVIIFLCGEPQTTTEKVFQLSARPVQATWTFDRKTISRKSFWCTFWRLPQAENNVSSVEFYGAYRITINNPFHYPFSILKLRRFSGFSWINFDDLSWLEPDKLHE